MTIERWLATRTPPPPALLRERLRSALDADASRDASEASEVCLSAAEAIVSRLLNGRSEARRQALDLLAADALVTYAFEAASERPEELAGRAAHAMWRISQLAVNVCA